MRTLLLLLLTLPAWAEPTANWHRLPTSNGLTAAVYNAQEDRVEAVFPHLWRDYGEGQPVQPWLQDLRWHAAGRPKVSYQGNTHVLKIDYPDTQVRLYAPFGGDHRGLALEIRGPHRLTFQGEAQLSRWGTRYLLTPKGVQPRCPDGPEQEVQRMRACFKNVPADLTPEERNLFEQSIAVLKMGQVSEQETPEMARGQIVASLPPGGWNIGWLRDATYAILALDRLGLHQEARRALAFFLNAKAGLYEHFVWKDGVDYGVGSPYLLTVCRYFGPGLEESDFNEFGPNIELDGFGLFLIALTDYVERSGDRTLLDGRIDRLNAEVILTLIEPSGLIRADSGPWEMHLPGRHNAWTSIACATGLQRYGELTKDERYTQAAARIKSAILKNFVHNGEFLKGFTEADNPTVMDFWDGGTIEAFAFGLLDDPALFNSHYAAYERALRLPNRGFARLNNPDWYTSSEWPFLSLRNAQSLSAHRRPAAAQKLIDRVTRYSALNYNLIAELYERETEKYGGAIPMVGYGAGAYVLAVLDARDQR